MGNGFGVAGGPTSTGDEEASDRDDTDPGLRVEVADIDEATPDVLRQAFLLLTREVSQKAGASLVDPLLRVVVHKHFAAAAARLVEEELDCVRAVIEQIDSDLESR